MPKNTHTAAPQALVTIARRRLQLGGMIYDRGVIVPPTAAGLNYRALLESHAIEQIPAHLAAGAGKPRKLAEPARVAPRKELIFVDDPDPVSAWRKTVKANAVNGDSLCAKDRLLATDRGSKMYRQAAKVGADRDAREKNLSARRIVPANL